MPDEQREALRSVASVAPGSIQELDALTRIDELREEEYDRGRDTPESRAQRSQRYWRRAGRARHLFG